MVKRHIDPTHWQYTDHVNQPSNRKRKFEGTYDYSSFSMTDWVMLNTHITELLWKIHTIVALAF